VFILAQKHGYIEKNLAKMVDKFSLDAEDKDQLGAKVVRHSCYVISQLAEVAVQRQLFAAIGGRSQRLAPAPARRGIAAVPAAKRKGGRSSGDLLP